MPAMASRVRVLASKGVHSSAALKTHNIWRSAIGYDPYTPAADSKGSKPNSSVAATENTYTSFQGLPSRASPAPPQAMRHAGPCKKFGRVGHLTYQCRNFFSFRDDGGKKDDSAIRAANAAFEKIREAASGGKAEESESVDGDDEDEESLTPDPDVDPEIERIIAERFGKSLSKKVETLSSKKRRRSHHDHRMSGIDDDESDFDRNRKHKRRRGGEECDSDSSEPSDGHQKRSDRHRKRRHKERRLVLLSESESTASSSDEDEKRERREKKWSRGHRRGEKKD